MDIKNISKDKKDFTIKFICPNCGLENISDKFSLSDCEIIPKGFYPEKAVKYAEDHIGSGYSYVVKCISCRWKTETCWRNSQIEEISEPLKPGEII